MANRFQSTLVYILFTVVVALKPAEASQEYCKDIFKNVSLSSDINILGLISEPSQKNDTTLNPGTVVLADSLVRAGASSLTALRIAINYPNLGHILLKKKITWVTLYRGLNIPSINHLNPNLYRFHGSGNGNVRPSLLHFFIPEQGFYLSSNINEALFFSHSAMFTDNKTKTGIILEIQVPSFLLDSSFALSDTATFLHRKYSPELDLWISRYCETDQNYDASNPKDLNSFEWKSYQDWYLTEPHVRKSGFFDKFMKQLYKLNHTVELMGSG